MGTNHLRDPFQDTVFLHHFSTADSAFRSQGTDMHELVDRRALTTFHHDLSKAVEQDLGYEVSIMTGEATLRREQSLRGSIDILKYKAQKLAEEYATLKEKFQGSGLKLSAEMAQYIVRTGQKEQFAEYQRSIDRQQDEERS